MAMVTHTTWRRPRILGIGGTTRVASATERLLRISLAAAEAEGAKVDIVTGQALDVPMYAPGAARDEPAQRLVEAFRSCDGIIIASPTYHGSISGLLKNALDYTEDLRSDRRVYFEGCAVGCICSAGGWQAAGQTLATLRAIVHALRGWPTPMGVIANTSLPLFDAQGQLIDEALRHQLENVGRQVALFCAMKAGDVPH